MTPAINDRLDHIAEIKPDHETPCLVRGCPENEISALCDYDGIVLDPKEEA